MAELVIKKVKHSKTLLLHKDRVGVIWPDLKLIQLHGEDLPLFSFLYHCKLNMFGILDFGLPRLSVSVFSQCVHFKTDSVDATTKTLKLRLPVKISLLSTFKLQLN